jgi:hypothetical protein
VAPPCATTGSLPFEHRFWSYDISSEERARIRFKACASEIQSLASDELKTVIAIKADLTTADAADTPNTADAADLEAADAAADLEAADAAADLEAPAADLEAPNASPADSPEPAAADLEPALDSAYASLNALDGAALNTDGACDAALDVCSELSGSKIRACYLGELHHTHAELSALRQAATLHHSANPAPTDAALDPTDAALDSTDAAPDLKSADAAPNTADAAPNAADAAPNAANATDTADATHDAAPNLEAADPAPDLEAAAADLKATTPNAADSAKSAAQIAKVSALRRCDLSIDDIASTDQRIGVH